VPDVRRTRGTTGLLGIGLLLLLAGTVFALAAPAAHARKLRPHRVLSPCAVKRSTTVALDSQARLYTRSQRGDTDQHSLVGCLLRSGRAIELESWFSCNCSRGDEVAPQVWLRGTVVAINRYGCAPDPLLGGCVGSARTFDLRTRRTLRQADTGTSVQTLVIGPGGAFAYVSSGGAVIKADADGTVVLDGGPGIDPDSLALGGAWVYWTRGGAPHSAQLKP
jgi:hypothetical protein